ncbi:MAG: rhomboid family intramembrane serine protease [Candidatus Binatia bacterium]
MTKGPKIPLRITHDHDLAEGWELVLVTQGLSPSVCQTRDGVVLSVPSDEVERAVAALSAYESENPPELQEGDEPVRSANLVAGIAVAGALLAFFFVTVTWKATVPWFERGSADAERIVLGELWRTVTGLTLHIDLVHAVTNAIATALFLGAVSGMLGAGLGSVLVLLAGAGGNLANALLHGPLHVSVGASTSVFGAVGMLGGLGVARRRRRGERGRRAWVPIAAALAILALLGTGGQRVDLWAHLFGFLLGGILGILITFIVPRPPGLGVQWALGSAALAVVITCWSLALR